MTVTPLLPLLLLLAFHPPSVVSQFFVLTTSSCTSSGYQQIDDFFHCKQGLADSGLVGAALVTPVPIFSERQYPLGCVYAGDQLKINQAATSIALCSVQQKCLCYVGSACPNTGGVVINTASCTCGRSVCTTFRGLYCFLTSHLCSKSSSFIAITSGHCQSYSAKSIRTTSDCNFAAGALSVVDITSTVVNAATVKSTHNLPSGCFLDASASGAGLTVNKYMSLNSNHLCSRTKTCLCAVVAACVHTNGATINSVPCACGTAASCTTTTGLFCDVADARGGATGQCALSQSGPWYVQAETNTCDVSVRSAVDCRDAAVQYGLSSTTPVSLHSSSRPSGCSFSSISKMLHFNTNMESTVSCGSASSSGAAACLCSEGQTVCSDVYGTAESSGVACRCGTSVCSVNTGMYCFARSSSCIRVPSEVATVHEFNLFRSGLGLPGF